MRGVPDGDGYFRVEGEVLVQIVEDDGLVKEVLRHKEVGALRCSLGLPVREELKCEVNLVKRIDVDLVLEDAVFVNDALEIYPHLYRP